MEDWEEYEVRRIEELHGIALDENANGRGHYDGFGQYIGPYEDLDGNAIHPVMQIKSIFASI